MPAMRPRRTEPSMPNLSHDRPAEPGSPHLYISDLNRPFTRVSHNAHIGPAILGMALGDLGHTRRRRPAAPTGANVPRWLGLAVWALLVVALCGAAALTPLAPRTANGAPAPRLLSAVGPLARPLGDDLRGRAEVVGTEGDGLRVRAAADL